VIGVVLHFYGSPPTLADVREFYARIVHREPSEEKVARLLQQYRAYGRPAPLGATVERIQRFLEERLNRTLSVVKQQGGGPIDPWEDRYLVRRAGKHAPPWVGDAVAELLAEGVSTIVSLPLTPFGSKLGSENYHRSVRRALEALGCQPVDLLPGASPPVDAAAMEGRTVGVIPVERWYSHELFLKASALRLGQALAWLPEDLRPFTAVVFTIHSMPEAEAGEGRAFPTSTACGLRRRRAVPGSPTGCCRTAALPVAATSGWVPTCARSSARWPKEGLRRSWFVRCRR